MRAAVLALVLFLAGSVGAEVCQKHFVYRNCGILKNVPVKVFVIEGEKGQKVERSRVRRTGRKTCEGPSFPGF